MVVAGAGHRDAQQILVLIHALDDSRQKQQELGVFLRLLAGVQQVLARVGGEGPVVVFAAAVNALKGLFVQQAHQAVLGGHVLHGFHGQLVVVGGHVGGGEDGRQLVLGRGHLVVLCLGQNAQLPQLLVQILHKGGNPGLDGAKVVVLQLLALGRLGPKQRAAGKAQVGALVIELLIHQEVLLLGAHGGHHPLGLLVAKQPQDAQRLGA